ncbi:MAG: N-6 DNA Methylase [Candidatus Scalindua rubra]|uniref:site-specific DNA-methyltransferase (adenine-specific) n=1 Tax=Candidatus Scalindua rubra TaxID=1872076 RepID=A0A1E3XC10_9BACT|nr:MAG: N-6 DNA Methylase [Candidatus Scalindua rubra]
MNDKIISKIENAFIEIGYRRNLIQKDYKYADLFSTGEPVRSIQRAVFGQEPFDYRSACFGVQLVDPKHSTFTIVNNLRALGAPQIFIINNNKTELWAITEGQPILQGKYNTYHLHNVIIQNEQDWQPQSIMRAKSGFAKPGPRQLDFVDIGLLPALEHEAAEKIDYLLRDILNYIEDEFKQRRLHFDAFAVFRIVFSLLAAKLLKDRNISNSRNIDFSLPQTALKAVQNHYGRSLTATNAIMPKTTLESISQKIGKSFQFCNLSVDTLTYIYENTFVSPESRRKLGIHSTPSYVANYILSQMPIEDLPRTQWHTTDPMCGHGIFLIAAMRRMRDLLPGRWNTQQRHKFFVEHLHGIEIDSFSIEVARMCLMLADFPEPNGWNLVKQDVTGKKRKNIIAQTMVLVGNPPFENVEGKRPQTPKPVELLRKTLPILPNNALVGMVLPRSFVDSSDYKCVRKSFLNDFELISLTALPDRIFIHSDSETAIIVARKQKPQGKGYVIYREIKDSDRESFRIRYRIPREDGVSQSYFNDKMQGCFIVPLLQEVWEVLEGCANLGKMADIKIGVQYKPKLREEKLSKIIRSEPFPDSKPGITSITEGFMQYIAEDTVYMSIHKQYRRFKTSTTWSLPWDKPKVIVPASRMSRGLWRFAAAIDKEGRIVNRRFYSIWPKSKAFDVELLAALLNSPIAEAFTYAHSFQRDIPKRIYESIPVPEIPSDIKQIIDSLVYRYSEVLQKDKTEARKILLQIDAEILKLYKLPPRLERKLLDVFWGQQRPVPFEFRGYIPPDIDSWIPLHIYISEQFNDATPDKIMKRIPIIRNTKFINYLKSLGRE